MIQSRPPGPLDIVGDVHGELDALRSLMQAAGYDAGGRHPQGRCLVFVGDLVDRGPDSPGVVRLVQGLVEAGRAWAVLGNHELNLLRGQRKPGNDWFWGEHTAHDQRYAPWAWAGPEARAGMLAFFARLPVALARADLRVVHAAWLPPAIEAVRAQAGPATPEGFARQFEAFDAAALQQLADSGVAAQAAAEHAQWRHQLGDPAAPMPLLAGIGQRDEARQMLNPLRVLTSGVERCATAPFYTGGRWRFAHRERWWDAPMDDARPVVIGHYWRQWQVLDRASLGKGDADLFDGVPPARWLGPQGRVFCVDYSVGGRYQERTAAPATRRTRLAALRWPEQQLLFDDGGQAATVGGPAQAGDGVPGARA